MCNFNSRRSDKEPCEACIPARELTISIQSNNVAVDFLKYTRMVLLTISGQSPSNDAV